MYKVYRSFKIKINLVEFDFNSSKKINLVWFVFIGKKISAIRAKHPKDWGLG